MEENSQIKELKEKIFELENKVDYLTKNNAKLEKKYTKAYNSFEKSVLTTEKQNITINDLKNSQTRNKALLKNLSHDIRNPMNVLVGFTNLLRNADITQSKRDEYIEIMNNSSKQLLNLVDDIVILSRIESNELEINPEITNLKNLINSSIQDFRSDADNRNIDISFELKAIAPSEKVLIDENIITIILSKLLNNSLKFTKEGSIIVDCQIKNDLIVFSVSDTGIGIPKEMHSKVFELFTRIPNEEQGKFEGSGLGLSIAKGLVKVIGGEIWLESNFGKGSTFSFSVPYSPVNEEKDEIKINQKIMNEKYENYTLLIAEDEEINYLYLEEILSDKPFTIIRAKDGREAIEFGLNNKIDLILMDIKMPFINGFEAAIEIRKHKPNVPMLAITAHAYTDSKVKAMEIGYNDYLTKPLKSKDLIEKINFYLG
jgi:CheY-like chemotaxis protein/nitrogen-specific signal transduction histidine kinase